MKNKFAKISLVSFDRIKMKAVPILKTNGVKKAGIFGSFARGEQKMNSDIDFLIEISNKKFSLFDLVKLKLSLEKEIGRKVDLVEYGYLHPLIREKALEEEIRII